MKLKTISYIFLCIMLINLAYAFQLTSFDGQTNPFNMTFDGLNKNMSVGINQNIIYVANLTFKIRSIYNNMTCYQESFNISNQQNNDGLCILNYTGSYWFETPFNQPENVVDGDYTTFGYAALTKLMNINYTIPQFVNLSASIWYIKTENLNSSLYLNQSCIDLAQSIGKLMLRWVSYGSSGRTVASCYTSADNLNSIDMTGEIASNARLYDEHMIWKINQSGKGTVNYTRPFNNTISIYDNYHLQYNRTYNFSNIYQISLNISSLNNILSNNQNINLTFNSLYDEVLEINLTNLTYSYGIDNCTNSQNIPSNATALNFTFLDENDDSLITSNISATFVLNNLNFTFSKSNINNFSICIYPSWLNVSVDAYFQYSGLEKERYYLDNAVINNQTQNIKLYNFKDITGITQFNVYGNDKYYLPYSDTIGQLQRYYPATNEWKQVQVDKVDNSGLVVYYVYQTNTDYKIVWVKDGTILDTTDPFKVLCTTTPCTQQVQITDLTSVYNYENFAYIYDYNNETGIVSITFSDTSGLLKSATMYVSKNNMAKDTLICNSSSTSASGTLTCDLNGYNGVFTVSLITSASPSKPLFITTISKIIDSLATALSVAGRTNDGLFLSFFLSVGIVTLGFTSPVLVVIFSIFSVIITYFLGAITLVNIGFLVSAILVGIIVAFAVKR